eukprot:COSAG02_NODE_31443_length_533_cov_1.069124_1_plen_71_part_10
MPKHVQCAQFGGGVCLPIMHSSHADYVRRATGRHRLAQNSMLSRVKMMLISPIICEKKQRLEVARGFTAFI